MKTRQPLFLAAAIIAAADVTHAQVEFTQIPVNSGYNFASSAWIDLDNDGFFDLIVANGVATSAGDSNVLFHNNRDGSFTQITSGPVASDIGYNLSVAGADYDNDNFIDLFFGGAFGLTATVPSLFYHNVGGGEFEPVTEGPVANTQGNFIASWVDFDNDGLVDLFLANTGGVNYLFRNQGNGSFVSVKPSIPAHNTGNNIASGSVWADYDNDGFSDVFIYGGSGPNLLFHNNGNGTFTQIHAEIWNTDLGPSPAAAWGDYDNDGFLDLVVSHGDFTTTRRRNYLYHNNGNGTFSKITTGVVATDLSCSIGVAWEDVDNDGYLDLFISQNTGSPGTARQSLFYHNNGDGTFASITNTLATAEPGSCTAVIWADYDNNGFPDLFIAAGEPSYIYHNEGNSNHWINFKLAGSQSNRSAIGAKVRVQATISGKTFWQMRHLSSDGLNPTTLYAHFGLGDATNALTVKIEWPSGTTQEFQNVAANQMVSVTEPSRLLVRTEGGSQLVLKGGRNRTYDIQTGTNLTDWSLLNTITITNLDGTAPVTPAGNAGGRLYYRARLR